MAVGRIVFASLLIQTALAGVSFADAYDSISWRWNGWTPPARTGSGGYNLPYSLLSSIPSYTPPSPVSWNVSDDARAFNPNASMATRPTSQPTVPSPAPMMSAAAPAIPAVQSTTPVAAISPAAGPTTAYGSAANTGLQWNYGKTMTSLAAATSGLSSNGGPTYNAYLNMGAGPFASASAITGGGAQAWYLSPVVEKLYGGVPTPDQQLQFTQAVLARVQSTYHNSGLDVSLTTNPNDKAQHQLSVVAGTASPSDPSAIGMTTVGQNGFSFIDKFSYATNVDQLEWALAHNVAHELTHAFGVDGHESSGNYLDSAITPWSTLIVPNATLSPGMINSLKSTSFGMNLASTAGVAAQELAPDAAAVPEPATYMTWAVAAVGLGIWARKGRKCSVALAA